jgi:hypothetical protein
VLEVLKQIALLLVGGLLAVGGFVAGRTSAPKELVVVKQAISGLVRVQNTQQAAPVNPNNDARELIPLNPGGQQPGQGQQPPPGQGQQPQDCPVQIYQDGKLYTFPQPGQQPQPGQNGNQPGRGGQPQEIIPLQPQTPSTTPQPSTPQQPAPAQPRSVPIQPSTPTPNTPTNPENPLNPFAPTLPNTRS